MVGVDNGRPLGFHGVGDTDTTGAPLPLAPTADPTASYLAGQAAGVAQGVEQGQTDLLNQLAAQGYTLTGDQQKSTQPQTGLTSNSIFIFAGITLVTVLLLSRR